MYINEVLEAVKGIASNITGCPFIMDKNTAYKPTLGTPWIRATISQGEPVQIVQGQNRMLRYSGIVQFDLFSPLNTGHNAFTDTLMAEFNKYSNRFVSTTNNTHKVNVDKAWVGPNTDENNWSRQIIFVRYFLNVEST